MLSTTAAEKALLTAPNVEFSGGLELLDESNNVVADISDDLVDGGIDYDNFAVVHGSCRLAITRRLNWGRDRVRPYVVVEGTFRANQGVYVLTTPSEQRGESPQTWDVVGYNLLHLLQDGPGDTYVATAGTTYLQAVRDVLTAAGLSVPLMMDGTLQATTLPATRVWGLVDGGASWLGVIDDLLDEINYSNLWCDRDGNLRSGPYSDPSTRPSEWTFDTSDEGTNIVHQDRTVTEDVANAVNWWKFYRTNLPYQPIDGDGIYLPPVNADEGDPTNNSLGRIVRKVVGLEAADQASLIAQGDRIVIEDQQVTRTVSLRIDPLPVQGHADVVTLIDEGVSEKLPTASWSLSLTGDAGHLTLGGTRKPVAERVDQQATATVTSGTAAGLRVVLDGAEVDSPAKALQIEDDAGVLRDPTYSIGQRVNVTVRTPQIPLVNGVETS